MNGQQYTIEEIAVQRGITRSRVHQLIKTYGVETIRIGQRLLVVTDKELRKIPLNRPNGVKISCR